MSRRAAGAPAGADPAAKLTRYRAKRHFDRTPEPSGAPAADGAATAAPAAPVRRFVVQRHRARRLHYDVRLEVDGVLVSWAVPKGPTLDPGVRRMAVHVEDHPLEYADFEGVIPAGEYGGGEVVVWDRGTWEPHGTDDPAAAIAAGELHADLAGDKLRGRFVFVRTGAGGRRGAAASGREDWLLLHKHDEHAVVGWSADEHPRSVLSGRTNDEVAADPDAVWRSDLPAAQAELRLRPRPAARAGAGPRDLSRHDVAAPTDDELAALDALGPKGGTWELHGRALKVTNLDKVLFPGRDGEAPVTKRDLVRYAATIAPVLVPHLAGRAVNMHRYPEGVSRKGFWHKEVPAHAPDWLQRWRNPAADPGETQVYVVVDGAPALVWMANFGAIEWHPWTSRVVAPSEPSFALIDVDPGTGTSWDEVRLLANLYRTALEHLGVTGYPKVTGQRGVQVWVPVAPGCTFAETRRWVETISRAIGRTVPELVSWEWEVAARNGLARLDYTQNAVNKTLVAPYSPRPAPGAPVSAPITWDELDDPDLRPDRWTIRTIGERIAERGDLFAGALVHTQHLPGL